MHISVVFERGESDIRGIFDNTKLCDTARQSGWWIIVFASIDGCGYFVLEKFLASERSVPFSPGGLEFGNIVALMRESAEIGPR